MKKIFVGTLTLLSVITLTACSNTNSTKSTSSSTNPKSSEKTSQTATDKSIKFYADAMKSDRVWLETQGTAKDSEVNVIIHIDKGNVTEYQLTSDDGMGTATNSVILGDFKDLTNEQILAKAKDLDSKATSGTKNKSTGNITIPLKVSASTDSTGNNITSETIDASAFPKGTQFKLNSALPPVQIYDEFYSGYSELVSYGSTNLNYFLTKGTFSTSFDSVDTKGITIK